MSLVAATICAAIAQWMGTPPCPQSRPAMTCESLAQAIAERLEALPELNIEVQYVESDKPANPRKEPAPTMILRASMARGGKVLVRAAQGDAELCVIASDGAAVTAWDCGARKWTRFKVSAPTDYQRAIRLMEDAPGRPRGLRLALGRFLPPWLDQPTGYQAFLEHLLTFSGATVSREDLRGRVVYVLKYHDSQSNGLLTARIDVAAAYDTATLLPVSETQWVAVEGLLALFAQPGQGSGPPYYSMQFRYDEKSTDLAAQLSNVEPPAGYIFVEPPPEDRKLNLVGQPLPSSFKLTSLDGADIPLTPQGNERCVLILVWATWCNPCRVEKDVLSKMAAEGELKGVRVIAVSVDHKPGTVRNYLKKHPLPFTVAWDPKFDVGTRSVPVTLLIDTKGVVRDGWTGFGEGQRNVDKLRAAIRACQE